MKFRGIICLHFDFSYSNSKFPRDDFEEFSASQLDINLLKSCVLKFSSVTNTSMKNLFESHPIDGNEMNKKYHINIYSLFSANPHEILFIFHVPH
jgi:hypothetical protein